MRKPNCFIGGAPKCGTTALHFYLSQHPDICMSLPKEPNYFSSLVTPFSRNDGEYISYCFSHCGNEHVVGEASPKYLICTHEITTAAISASVYNQLLEEKEGEIKELSALIRRDLSHWLIPQPEDHPHE